MENNIKDNLKEKSTWMRGLYMILFVIFAGIANVVICGIVIFQFFHKLFTSDTNERLLTLGQSLATYTYQILQFLTFNSEHHPYPLGDWPNGEPKAAKKPAPAKAAVKEPTKDAVKTPAKEATKETAKAPAKKAAKKAAKTPAKDATKELAKDETKETKPKES